MYVEQTLEAVAARVEILEGQVSELFGKMNDTRETQASIVTKLDNVLLTIGEVKQAVAGLQSVPGNRWNALIISAAAALLGAAIGHFIK